MKIIKSIPKKLFKPGSFLEIMFIFFFILSSKGIIPTDQVSIALKNITINTDMKSLKNCHLIIEAVKEDFNIKSEIIKKLDNVCNQNT